MAAILKLIRVRTLLFALVCMAAMRWLVVGPILGSVGVGFQLSGVEFGMVCAAVCCLVIAAYVINDYFDTKSDRISGIRNVVVGKCVSRREAIGLHTMFNVMAVVLAGYVALGRDLWMNGLAFLLVSVILWMYSSFFKRLFLVGNLLVAFLSALIPLTVLLFELPLAERSAGILLEESGAIFSALYWVLSYSWFVFLNVLMYVINKDMYTVEGDREDGIRTIAVQAGTGAARRAITALAVLGMVSAVVGYLVEFRHFSPLYLLYLILFVLLPYALYILVLNGRDGSRMMQLNLIRFLMVSCLGISVLEKLID